MRTRKWLEMPLSSIGFKCSIGFKYLNFVGIKVLKRGEIKMSATLWDTSATVYHSEVEHISFYQVTNRELITAARIQSGMSLIDLACGTGFTTRTILDVVGTAIMIYAVEQSHEMLAQAQSTITTATIRFIHASAEHFSSHIPEPVDRVVCNAAFFLFPNIDAVLKEIHTVLKPEGLFVFNIPDQKYDFGDGKPSEMARAVAKYLDQSLSIASLKTFRYSSDTIHTLASTHGFQAVDFKVVGLQLDVDDLIRFYSIPHFSSRRFPSRSSEELKEIVAARFRMLPAGEAPYYRWAQFVFTPQ